MALLASLSFNVLAKNDFQASDKVISKSDAISDDFNLAVNLSAANGICNDAFTQYVFFNKSMKASLECLENENLSKAASHAANAKAWATALKANPNINTLYEHYVGRKEIDTSINAIDRLLKVLRMSIAEVSAKVHKIESSIQEEKVESS